MAFDYFYGQEDAEQFLFYRIPKTLINGEEFREVSVEAKLLLASGDLGARLTRHEHQFDSPIMAYFQHPSFGSHSVTGTLG